MKHSAPVLARISPISASPLVHRACVNNDDVSITYPSVYRTRSQPRHGRPAPRAARIATRASHVIASILATSVPAYPIRLEAEFHPACSDDTGLLTALSIEHGLACINPWIAQPILFKAGCTLCGAPKEFRVRLNGTVTQVRSLSLLLSLFTALSTECVHTRSTTHTRPG